MRWKRYKSHLVCASFIVITRVWAKPNFTLEQVACGRWKLATASPSHCIQSYLYPGSLNTSDWVFRDGAFMDWMDNAVCYTLQLCGDDGSGKTTLVRFLVEHLGKSSTVISFFCTHQDDSRQSAKDILLSMVNQLLFHEPHLYSDIEKALSENENPLWTKEASFGVHYR